LKRKWKSDNVQERRKKGGENEGKWGEKEEMRKKEYEGEHWRRKGGGMGRKGGMRRKGEGKKEEKMREGGRNEDEMGRK
jgi:hypothetical protein